MTTAKRLFLTLAVAAATATPLFAYNDTATHPHLTMFSVQKSVLYKDGQLMVALGLPPVNKQLYEYRARVESSWLSWLFPSINIQYPVSSLIGEGAYDEDQEYKPSSHFFDPYFMRGLTTFTYPEGEWSYRWALEPDGEVVINGGLTTQEFSLADARDYLGIAMRAASEETRKQAMMKVYLSLGHAVHHIQDMAQPQHTRNDIHVDNRILGLARGLTYDPSLYETYTQERDAFLDTFMATGNPVFPGGTFKTATDFWLNPDQTGISQDTNRRFVSKGTNFTMNGTQVNVGTYPDPIPTGSSDVKATELFTTVPPEIAAVCGSTGVDCTMTFYSTETTPRASTLSIFDQDLRGRNTSVSYLSFLGFPAYKTDRIFALNRFNFDDVHPYLLANAVSYSAGIINHFFRGRLTVMPPETGPYAAVDQSTGQGFKKLKVRVKNSTPNEKLTGGTLQAFAKFHRNGCYQADLSGEFRTDDSGNLITPCPNYRSDQAEVRFTTEDQLSFDVDEVKDMTLEFNDEIPIDATDLFIQVYYRGKVGDQENDFAIGAVDVSEPTFMAVMNGTDMFELNANGFYYYNDIINNITQQPYSIVDIDGNGKYNSPPDVDVRGGSISYEIKINGDAVGQVTLGEGRFARVAALVNPVGFELTLIASGNGFNDITAYNMPAKMSQVDYDRNAFLVTPVGLLRKQTYQWDSVTYFHYWPTTGTPLKDMKESKAADATTPVAVTMTH